MAAGRKCDRHTSHDDTLVTQLLTPRLRRRGWGASPMVILAIGTHHNTKDPGNRKIEQNWYQPDLDAAEVLVLRLIDCTCVLETQ